MMSRVWGVLAVLISLAVFSRAAVQLSSDPNNSCTALRTTSKAVIRSTCNTLDVQYTVTYNISDLDEANDAVVRATEVAYALKAEAEKVADKELILEFTSVTFPENKPEDEPEFSEYDDMYPSPWRLHEDLHELKEKVDLLTNETIPRTSAALASKKRSRALKVKLEVRLRDVPVSTAQDVKQLLAAMKLLEGAEWKRRSMCTLSEEGYQAAYEKAVDQALSTAQSKAERMVKVLGRQLGELRSIYVDDYSYSYSSRFYLDDDLEYRFGERRRNGLDLDSDLITVDVPFSLPKFPVDAHANVEYCMIEGKPASA